MAELSRKRKRSIEVDRGHADFKVEETKRRQSYPLRRISVLVTKPKRVLNNSEDRQKSNGRRSYPIFDPQAHVANRKGICNDESEHQSLKRRKFSLGKYYRVLSSKRIPSSSQDTDGVFFCIHCPKGFSSKRLLDLHVIQTHTEPASLSTNSPTEVSISRRKGSVIVDVPMQNSRRKTSVIIIQDDESRVPTPRRQSLPKKNQAQQLVRTRSVIYISDDDDTPNPTSRLRRRSVTKTSSSRNTKSKTAKKDHLKPINCEYCQELFQLMNQKQEHLIQAHPVEFDKLRNRCASCHFRFRLIKELDKHRRDEHEKKPEYEEGLQLRDNEVNCFICSGVFIKKELAKHIKERHKDTWEEGSTVKQMEKRYCPLCKDSIRRLHEQGKGAPKNLKSHIRITHPEKYNKDAEAKDMLFPEKKRITKWENCPVCGLRYTADQLERHMQIKHRQD